MKRKEKTATRSTDKQPQEEFLQDNPNHLDPGELKPKLEGINNTDFPGVPDSRKAKNNPTHQNEGLSGGGEDPLADL